MNKIKSMKKSFWILLAFSIYAMFYHMYEYIHEHTCCSVCDLNFKPLISPLIWFPPILKLEIADRSPNNYKIWWIQRYDGCSKCRAPLLVDLNLTCGIAPTKLLFCSSSIVTLSNSSGLKDDPSNPSKLQYSPYVGNLIFLHVSRYVIKQYSQVTIAQITYRTALLSLLQFIPSQGCPPESHYRMDHRCLWSCLYRKARRRASSPDSYRPLSIPGSGYPSYYLLAGMLVCLSQSSRRRSFWAASSCARLQNKMTYDLEATACWNEIRTVLVLHVPDKLPRSMLWILARVTSGFSTTIENVVKTIQGTSRFFFGPSCFNQVIRNAHVQSNRLWEY